MRSKQNNSHRSTHALQNVNSPIFVKSAGISSTHAKGKSVYLKLDLRIIAELLYQ